MLKMHRDGEISARFRESPMSKPEFRMNAESPMTNWSFGFGHWFVILVCAFVIPLSSGCDRSAPSTTQPSFTSPRIASLVPAATDLIVSMDAKDHLVAVSNWDKDRPEIVGLPRVGDYQELDWEKVALARPDVMIVFMDPQRMPAGVVRRAEQLHIQLVNVKTERVADVFSTIDSLGQLMKEPQKAAGLSKRIHAQLDAVAARVAGKPPVPALLARADEGFEIIAGDTFTDDLLTLAGGKNVAGQMSTRYPSTDAERIMEMSPAVVFHLLPDGTEQSVDRVKRMWARLEKLPATRDKRVFVMTDWYVLHPGAHIGDVAEAFADKLHPR